jgi:hypothetical protein
LQKSNYIKTDNVKQDKDIPKQLEELNNLYKSVTNVNKGGHWSPLFFPTCNMRLTNFL